MPATLFFIDDLYLSLRFYIMDIEGKKRTHKLHTVVNALRICMLYK